jgi:hypothetical protein
MGGATGTGTELAPLEDGVYCYWFLFFVVFCFVVFVVGRRVSIVNRSFLTLVEKIDNE